MKANKKRSKSVLFGLIAILVMVPVGVLLVKRMEGKPPEMVLKLEGAALGAEQTLSLEAADAQTGLRQVWMALLKDGKETVLLDKQFKAINILSGGAVRKKSFSIPIDAKALGLTDGKAVLRLVTRDLSWRSWGKGNKLYQEKDVIIDTKAPIVSILSGQLNLNQGGAGLVIYKLSEECPSSGIMVGEEFYPGRTGAFSDKGIYMTFIALNHKQGANTRLVATATDFAGNVGKRGVPRHVNARKFKKDTIRLSDNFLSWKVPELQDQVAMPGDASLLDTFVKVNSELRQANYEAIKKVVVPSDDKVYWKGAFTQLPRSANRAGYAEFRTYQYKGKTVDRQTHLGVDLASNSQAPVPAGNAGKVAFADNLGIYGSTVIIDHGFGLFSLYSHLSEIGVPVGEKVAKGDIIGRTGATGLAGGDHLHFGMLVHHTFVNPFEWWDPKWIQNNVASKIEAVH